MKWHLQIAWRNLWRNPRRTAVILVAIAAGSCMMLLMSALMWGMVQGMLANALASLTGHIQVHHPDYLGDPAVDNRFRDTAQLRDSLAEILPTGSRVAWRVRLDMVCSNARHSASVTIVGCDLPTEAEVTFLKESRMAGQLPGRASAVAGILVGRRLLEDFETRIGNKLILTARKTDGEIASMAFQITGTFDTFLESSETGFAFADIDTVRRFLGMEGEVTEISVTLPDIDATAPLAQALRARLDPIHCAVTQWQEQAPLVTAYIDIWDTFSYVWALVIFIAMGFGLVNTLLMAVYERVREFGLVRALGLAPMQIVGGVLVESLLLLLVGLLAGNVIAAAIVVWLDARGIDLAAFSGSTEMLGLSRMIHPRLQWRDMAVFNTMVVALGMLVSLYPAAKAARFTPVQAMTHFK